MSLFDWRAALVLAALRPSAAFKPAPVPTDGEPPPAHGGSAGAGRAA